MITQKEIYNYLVQEGTIQPVQPISVNDAIKRYTLVREVYGEAYSLYSESAYMQGFTMKRDTQCPMIMDKLYNTIEQALDRTDLKVLSRGLIKQLGFNTKDGLLKIVWLMNSTQAINGVSIEYINNIAKEAIQKHAWIFRTYIDTEEGKEIFTSDNFMNVFLYNINKIGIDRREYQY